MQHEGQTAYTALIRTYNSMPLVAEVVEALRLQTRQPARIIAVDSSTSHEHREQLVGLVDELLVYPAETFNFSKAINIGVDKCETPWVLVISSHVVLHDREAIAKALSEMMTRDCFAFYIYPTHGNGATVEVISASNFDGRNGLSNACAFLPVSAIQQRPFREDVFSAEDQEWAAHHMRAKGARIVRIGNCGLAYLNSHVNEVKFINEEIAIAYFACREKLGVIHLARWLFKGIVYLLAGRTVRAKTYFTLFTELAQARWRPPTKVSKYF